MLVPNQRTHCVISLERPTLTVEWTDTALSCGDRRSPSRALAVDKHPIEIELVRKATS
jgi:hypothetical protein